MTSDTQDLKALVEQAHEAVACLKEEDAELHRIAFQQVLQHLLTNGAPPAKDQSAAPAREMPPFDRVFGSERHRVAAVARRLDLELEQVRQLFDLTGDEPALRMDASKLAPDCATATKQITLLLIAARTALETATGTVDIWNAVDAHDKLDPANFMATLEGMDQISMRGRRNSRNRAVNLRGIGIEQATRLAQQLFD